MDIINTEAIAREARQGINELHKKTIGLFRPYALDKPELVVKNDEGHLGCVNFGSMGHISTLYISAKQGVLVMFEEGKTLADLSHDEYVKALETINKK
jgi:hypothetical protein